MFDPEDNDVEPMTYCPVCSDVNHVGIMHTPPPCEKGKPAFVVTTEEN